MRVCGAGRRRFACRRRPLPYCSVSPSATGNSSRRTSSSRACGRRRWWGMPCSRSACARSGRPSAIAPRFVATVHRRGYRFIAGVTDSEPRPERDGASERSPVGSTPTGGGFRYRGPAHLVGREPALDRLQRGIEAAWRGTRQIVFVTGEPGIGKTGVVGTFLERVTIDPRVWIAHGQCVETSAAPEPYLPVLDAFGRLCRDGT